MIARRRNAKDTGQAMQSYRYFSIDLGGHIAAADILECVDDDEAARASRRVLEQHAAARRLEIWRLDRCIGVLTRDAAAE
jgi:hypothetical protein